LNQNGEGPVLIPAKQYQVWSRLYNRFLLEPSPAVGSNAYVSPIIQPITDADRLLKQLSIGEETLAIAAIGVAVFFTVPGGERWSVTYQRAARASGTMTHNSFVIVSPAGVEMEIDEYTQTAATHLHEYLQPLVLDEGWGLGVFIDTHSVAGNVECQILYEQESAF